MSLLAWCSQLRRGFQKRITPNAFGKLVKCDAVMTDENKGAGVDYDYQCDAVMTDENKGVERRENERGLVKNTEQTSKIRYQGASRRTRAVY